MAQLVIAAAGAWAGGALAAGAGYAAGAAVAFGMSGNAIGWAVGSMVGSMFGPTQKSTGPRLGDLTVTGASYGTPIPYVKGHPRIAGNIIWGRRNEIETVTRQGKGGGAQNTSYTYTADLLLKLSSNVIGGVSRIWIDGELVYTQLASAGADSINASIQTDRWTRMTVYTGDSAQMPDPTYEEAVGNAPAYRGCGTMFLEGLQLGGGGQITNIQCEVYEQGTLSALPMLYFTLRHNSPNWVDVSSLALAVLKQDDPSGYTIATDSVNTLFGNPTAKLSPEMTSRVSFTTGHGARFEVGVPSIATGDFTIETFVYLDPAKDFGGGWLFNKDGFGYAFAGPSNPDAEYTRGAYSCWVTPTGGIRFFVGPGQSAGVHQEFSVVGFPLGQWSHVAIVKQDEVISIYVNGTRQVAAMQTIPMGGVMSLPLYIGNIWSQSHPVIVTTGSFIGSISEFRLSHGKAHYTGASLEVPTAPFGTANALTLVDSTVQAVALDVFTRTGLSAGQVDVSALASITTPVRAMAIGQVSTARQVLEMLAGAYFIDFYLRDKIYCVPRGGAPAATLAYEDIGWTVEGAEDDDPLPITHGNELEAPAQIALTFQGIDADYQADTQYSDRLISGQTSTSAVQLPLALTASEAKAIADRMLFDQAWQMQTKVSLSLAHTHLENTDVIVLTGADGSTYRTRIVKRSDADGLMQLDCVFDDATIATQAGITVGNAQTQTSVAAPAQTTLVVIDGPLLRDADDRPGVYVAAAGTTANWNRASVYVSLDDSDYTLVNTIAEPAVLGRATTTLGNYTGWADLFDEVSTLTVNVGVGQLSSVTNDQIFTSPSANAMLVGSEVIQFRTAALVSPGVYTLSGLLRGRRGTGWAVSTHAAYERVVLLDTPGMRFVPLDSSELGKVRYFKGVSAGQRLVDAVAHPITPVGVSLECFAPVDAQVDRAAADHVISCRRGTRLSTRLVGSLPISAPLGEASEAYECDVFSSGAFTTVVRTLTSTNGSFTYTSAQRTADGTGSSVLYLRIYQLSANVGRGYVLQATI